MAHILSLTHFKVMSCDGASAGVSASGGAGVESEITKRTINKTSFCAKGKMTFCLLALRSKNQEETPYFLILS